MPYSIRVTNFTERQWRPPITELLNSFADSGPQLRLAVARAVESVRSNRNVVVVPQTSEQFEKALRRYRAMSDKSWSLTDCASFLIMEVEAIRAALTHDRHFEQAGFQTILRSLGLHGNPIG